MLKQKKQLNLHSNMVRFIIFGQFLIKSMADSFTFQYG